MNKSSRSVMSFTGGIHPSGNGKELSRREMVRVAPLLDVYRVLLAENAGAPPEPVVKVGDKVKKYQLIAKASGPVSANLHAPTSGQVSAISEIPGPFGVPAMAISITSDHLDEGEPMVPVADWRSADAAVLLQRVADAGIVGMGGASFPSHVKLSPPKEKTIDTVILNGAECEPYLTADHRLMLEEPRRVLAGAAIIGRILGVTNIHIGVEVNKSDAIAALQECAAEFGVVIDPLAVQYPQGSEKQLINAIPARTVPTGRLPMDSGCVVQNVGTAAAIASAVIDGIPLIERITTITGEVVKHPGNWKLRIGTPVIEAVKLCGGVTAEPGKLILGGPMMGFAQHSFEVPVAKNSSGILLLSSRVAMTYNSSGCIRCGRCVQGCPMGLVTCMLATAIEGGRFDLAAQNHVMDCLECGSCAYVCPARRPLVQQIRRAKAEIRRARGKK